MTLRMNSQNQKNKTIMLRQSWEKMILGAKHNDEIVGGIFLFLFLRRHKILHKSSFSASLIMHLLLYYYRRFEINQHLIHFLFNQQIRHVAIRTIARSGSRNKNYLEKLGKLLKDKVFKKSLSHAVENPNEKSNIEMNHKVLRITSFSGKELVFRHLRDHNRNQNWLVSLCSMFFNQHSWLPEYDDFPLLKMSIIRQKGIYNNRKQQLIAADEEEMGSNRKIYFQIKSLSGKSWLKIWRIFQGGDYSFLKECQLSQYLHSIE